MNSLRLRIPSLLVGAMLVASLAVQAQQPPKRGRAVIFSDPKGETGTTNLDAGSKRRSLQNLEDQFKKPFEVFDMSERQTVAPPLQQLPKPNLENKKLRELFEKEKDWAFKTREDYERELGLSAPELLKISEFNEDGTLKKKTSAMERWYERSQNPHLAKTNHFGTSTLSPWGKEKDEREEESRLGTALSLEQSLKLVPGDKDDPHASDPTKPRTIADFFGFKPESAAAKAQEQRIEEYKKILDPHAPTKTPTASLFANPAAPTPSLLAPPKLAPLPSAAPPRDNLGFLPSAVGTVSAPIGLPSAFPPQGSTTTPLPTAEKPTTTPAPAFALPKRKF